MYGDTANRKDFASEPIGDEGYGSGEQWPRNAGSVISGFRREVDEHCVITRRIVVNFLPTFRDNLSVPPSRVKVGALTLEGGTDRMSRNVGKKFTTTRRAITKRKQFFSNLG
jgi:hypothetical protein